VKLVLTLVVRDEADVLRSNLDFHLHAGVDVVIATDHGSTDGTREILEEYARDGAVDLIREEVGAEFRQREWMTRMARLAATRHAADWVVSSDADEFWWPRAGSLKEVLDAIPRRYGIVQTFVRHFPPVAPDDSPFFERMVYRLSPLAPINDPASPWRPFRKTIHRARPDTVVTEGAHGLMGSGLRPLRGWYPVEVLHFPIRSPGQLARKGAVWGPAVAKYFSGVVVPSAPGAVYHAQAYRESERGTSQDYYASLQLEGDALAGALADGVVQTDTRLRDLLHSLAAGERPAFPRPDAVEDARFAVDVAALGEADVIRTQRRLDGLEARLAAVERTLPARVERRLRRLVRKGSR
jgi:hypothetical protein